MFGKTKQIKEEVDKISEKLLENQKTVDELNLQLRREVEELKEIKKEQTGYLADLQRNSQNIKELRKELDEEVRRFKVFRVEIQRQIVEQFEKELKQNFLTYNEALKIDKESYDARKQQINAIMKDILTLKNSIDNLSQVAGKIRKQDFELTQFQSKLLEEDKNKLELLRKIDYLEKVCARLKRGGR